MNNEMIFLHETTSKYKTWSKTYDFTPVKDGKVIKHSKLLTLDLLERCYLSKEYVLIDDVTEKELTLKRSENKFLLIIGDKVLCALNAKGKAIPKWFSSKTAAFDFFKDRILVGDFLKHWGIDGYFYHGKSASCGWIIPKQALLNDLITYDFVEVFNNSK